MSDPKKVDPDEDLLEFLGGIDEVNDDTRDGDFSDFLASADLDKVAERPRTPQPPAKEGKRD